GRPPSRAISAAQDASCRLRRNGPSHSSRPGGSRRHLGMTPTPPAPELHERDAMICRACGNEERASEGYPCADCGTFICIICSLRGVVRCRSCEEKAAEAANP